MHVTRKHFFLYHACYSYYYCTLHLKCKTLNFLKSHNTCHWDKSVALHNDGCKENVKNSVELCIFIRKEKKYTICNLRNDELVEGNNILKILQYRFPWIIWILNSLIWNKNDTTDLIYLNYTLYTFRNRDYGSNEYHHVLVMFFWRLLRSIKINQTHVRVEG